MSAAAPRRSRAAPSSGSPSVGTPAGGVPEPVGLPVALGQGRVRCARRRTSSATSRPPAACSADSSRKVPGGRRRACGRRRPASRRRRAAGGSPGSPGGRGPARGTSPGPGRRRRWSCVAAAPAAGHAVRPARRAAGRRRRSRCARRCGRPRRPGRPDQQRVAVAVQRDRPHVLDVAGGVALDPVLAGGCGTSRWPGRWSGSGAAPRRPSRRASAPRRCRTAARRRRPGRRRRAQPRGDGGVEHLSHGPDSSAPGEAAVHRVRPGHREGAPAGPPTRYVPVPSGDVPVARWG